MGLCSMVCAHSETKVHHTQIPVNHTLLKRIKKYRIEDIPNQMVSMMSLLHPPDLPLQSLDPAMGTEALPMPMMIPMPPATAV